MPRAKTIMLYKFSELSKKAQEHALDNNRDWNVDGDWWDSTYEDAERIGLKIKGFDDYKAEGELEVSVFDCCKKIMEEHGEVCETYKLAKEYDTELMVLEATFNSLKGTYQTCKECDGVGWITTAPPLSNRYFCWTCDKTGKILIEGDFEEPPRLVEEFTKALLQLYKNMLDEEYTYLTGDEAIQDSFEANETEFTKEGVIEWRKRQRSRL